MNEHATRYRSRKSRRRSAGPSTLRRGSVIVVVIWALAIAALATAAVQLVSYRQAVSGREALGRVQARWAARAGIEETIAVMAFHTESPDVQDAFAMVREMESVSFGRTSGATWDIRHFSDGQEWAGPMDEHSKLHIAGASPLQLLNLPRMTPDVVDAIRDWQDADDVVTGMGAERDYYLNAGFGYIPRNAPMKSIAELELVAGAWPQNVRGEDWNLNSRLDPNEDDGGLTWPRDNADGVLDAGWSGFLTAYSRAPIIGASGEPRINVRQASPEELQARFGVDETQAAALQTYFAQPNSRLEPLLVTDLGILAQSAMQQGGQQQGGAQQGGGGRGSGGGGGGATGNVGGTGGGAAGGGGARGGGGGGGARGGDQGFGAIGGAGGGGRGGAAAGGGGGRGGAAAGGRGGQTQRGLTGGPGGAVGGGPGGAGGIGGAGGAAGGAAMNVPPLDTEQLRLIFQEGMVGSPNIPMPGRMNINTVSREMLTEILELDTRTADAIIQFRESRPEGYTSLADLLDVPMITPDQISMLSSYFDTMSMVYSISSKGRSTMTGQEVEIFVVVDRSTFPIRIIEYREQ